MSHDAETGKERKQSKTKQLLQVHKDSVSGIHKESANDVNKSVPKMAAKGKQMHLNKTISPRSPKIKSSKQSRSHDNHAFEDDDGATPTTENQIAVPKEKLDLFHPRSQQEKAKKHVKLAHKDNSTLGDIAEDNVCFFTTVDKSTNKQIGNVPNEQTYILSDMKNAAKLSNALEKDDDNGVFSSETPSWHGARLQTVIDSTDNHLQVSTYGGPIQHADHKLSDTSPPSQHYTENVHTASLAPRQRPPNSWFTRPHSRSVSSVLPLFSSPAESQDLSSLSVQRSFSMRLHTDKPTDKPKPRALLRDLSFSDADSIRTRNYGSLRGGMSMPRRKPLDKTIKQDDDGDDSDVTYDVDLELRTQMKSLMFELLERGKVRQVALLTQDKCRMFVSVPDWNLAHSDVIGLVKAATTTVQTIIRLPVAHETYTLFKHGPDKVMGRSGDNVLVAQKTKCYVIVGVADDNTPGSCLYEISELVNTLVNKGW